MLIIADTQAPAQQSEAPAWNVWLRDVIFDDHTQADNVLFTEDGGPYMVFELMELGDLTQLLRNNDPQFGDKCEIQLGNVITIAY